MELMVSVICDVAFELQKTLHSIYNSNQLDLHPCLSSSYISLQMSWIRSYLFLAYLFVPLLGSGEKVEIQIEKKSVNISLISLQISFLSARSLREAVSSY